MRKNALSLGGSLRFETQPWRNAAPGLEAVQKLSKLPSYLTLVSRWASGVPLWRQLEVASRSWRAGIVASARVSSADPWSGRARNAEVRRQQGGWEMNCRENTHGEVENWGAESLHPLETRKQTFRSPSALYIPSTSRSSSETDLSLQWLIWSVSSLSSFSTSSKKGPHVLILSF